LREITGDATKTLTAAAQALLPVADSLSRSTTLVRYSWPRKDVRWLSILMAVHDGTVLIPRTGSAFGRRSAKGARDPRNPFLNGKRVRRPNREAPQVSITSA
jgi:hypothetical protein